MNKSYNDNEWFEQDKLDKKKYFTIRLFEKDQNCRKNVKEALIETIINYYIAQDTINDYLNDVELFNDLECVINNAIPDSNSEDIRKGDFSEIISSEHLIQNYGYYLPYIKLQNKPNKNQSNQGDDIFGFKFEDDEIKEICLGEVKFLSKFNNNVFKRAHNQLKKSYNPQPKSLNMIVNYVVNQKHPQSQQFKKLLSPKKLSKIKINNWLFCVTEKSHNNLDIYNEDELLENLTLVSFYLPDIADFINEVYNLSSGYYNDK